MKWNSQLIHKLSPIENSLIKCKDYNETPNYHKNPIEPNIIS